MDNRPEFRQIVKELSRIQNSELKSSTIAEKIVLKLPSVILLKEKEAQENLLLEKSLQIINLGYSLSPTSSEYFSTLNDVTG